SQTSFSLGGKSSGIGMKPPSPWTGSSTTHATDSGATSCFRSSSSPRSASSEDTPRNGYGAGARYTSGANGPKPRLYGTTFEVSAIVRFVRPWKAWSKAITAVRPVATRAILTAFSTASAPELTSSDFVSAVPGHVSLNNRQTSMYGSYMPTMK